MTHFKLMAPIVEEMKIFASLGKETVTNGTMLFGKAPHVGKEAFLHTLYPPLKDNEIGLLAEKIGMQIPGHLANLYRECNGFHYFVDVLTVDGLRGLSGRGADAFYQPYDLVTTNVDERISDAGADVIFFGGYDWDGSLLYTKHQEEKVFMCAPDSTKPLKIWSSMDKFLSEEAQRIFSLFDKKGALLNSKKSTLPV